MYRKDSRMIEVTDCYGNAELVILLKELRTKPRYKVSVMVTDGYGAGMEINYETNFAEIAISQYNTWRHYIYSRVPNQTNKEWFIEHGFTNI
jgi:hypothetical protein